MKKASKKVAAKKAEMKEEKMEAVGPFGDSKEDSEPQEYQIKDAADTLLKAEEIKKDSKLMPHVHKHMSKKMEHMKSVSSMEDLKARRDAVMLKKSK